MLQNRKIERVGGVGLPNNVMFDLVTRVVCLVHNLSGYFLATPRKCLIIKIQNIPMKHKLLGLNALPRIA